MTKKRNRNQPTADTIGARIRAARTAAKLRQIDACKLIGVPQARWSEWESGEVIPRADTFIRIADALGVKLETLKPEVQK